MRENARITMLLCLPLGVAATVALLNLEAAGPVKVLIAVTMFFLLMVVQMLADVIDNQQDEATRSGRPTDG